MVSADAAAQREVVGDALERGITLFDTSAAYGDGASETNLGRVLAELGAAHVAVNTKVVVGEGATDPRAEVLRGVEGSLRRLRRDRVDSLLLHNRIGPGAGPSGPGFVRLTEEQLFGSDGVVAAFTELKASGTVGAVGFSAWGVDPVIARAAVASGSFDVVNTVLPGPEEPADLVTPAREAGLGVMAIRVLSGGAVHGGVGAAVRRAVGFPGVSTAVIGFSETAHVRAAVEAVAGAERVGP